MIKIIKLIQFFLYSKFNKFLLAENTFFEEGKKNIMKKNMKNQNFYFKEV